MANSNQARKRARQAENGRRHNASMRSMMRTHIKNVQKAISEGNKKEAEAAYKAAAPVIDKMASKGIIHK
ncbi:MAG: 30S ribosomal protein S20, partial [Gammaproteobacteria bacterium]|nr:30S ribosomal protein S20 [Gammaproteobacteria bacterium]